MGRLQPAQLAPNSFAKQEEQYDLPPSMKKVLFWNVNTKGDRSEQKDSRQYKVSSKDITGMSRNDMRQLVHKKHPGWYLRQKRIE